MINGAPVRRRGLFCPWHPLQVAAWVIKGVFSCHYLLWVLPGLPSDVFWPCFVVPFALFVVVLGTGAWLMSMDPTSPHLKQKLSGETVGESDDLPRHCTWCELDVAERTKHCRSCNRCVDQFDHHCKWLNTCVGGVNYHVFFVYLVATYSAIGCYVVGCLFACTWLVRNPEEFDDTIRANPLFPLHGSEGPVRWLWLAVVLAPLVVALAGLLLLGDLLMFHVELRRSSRTTYEFIISMRERSTAIAEYISFEKAHIDSSAKARATRKRKKLERKQRQVPRRLDHEARSATSGEEEPSVVESSGSLDSSQHTHSPFPIESGEDDASDHSDDETASDQSDDSIATMASMLSHKIADAIAPRSDLPVLALQDDVGDRPQTPSDILNVVVSDSEEAPVDMSALPALR
jgi:palmitoyltransferase ZDHHC1/11